MKYLFLICSLAIANHMVAMKIVEITIPEHGEHSLPATRRIPPELQRLIAAQKALKNVIEFGHSGEGKLLRALKISPQK